MNRERRVTSARDPIGFLQETEMISSPRIRVRVVCSSCDSLIDAMQSVPEGEIISSLLESSGPSRSLFCHVT